MGNETIQKKERESLWVSFDISYKRPVEERIRKGVLHTYKPVLDDGPPIRMWDTMEDYKRWCDENLPEWLGYRRMTDEEWQEMLDHALDE